MRAQPNRVELSARELQDVFETYAVFRYHATNHGQPTTAYAVDAVCAHAHTDTPPAERRHAEGRAVGGGRPCSLLLVSSKQSDHVTRRDRPKGWAVEAAEDEARRADDATAPATADIKAGDARLAQDLAERAG